MPKTMEVMTVDVSLTRWSVEFSHRLDALCKRTHAGEVREVALREDTLGRVRRGMVLLYLDPIHPGRAVAVCNPVDREWAHRKLTGMEPERVTVEALQPLPANLDRELDE